MKRGFPVKERSVIQLYSPRKIIIRTPEPLMWLANVTWTLCLKSQGHFSDFISIIQYVMDSMLRILYLKITRNKRSLLKKMRNVITI